MKTTTISADAADAADAAEVAFRKAGLDSFTLSRIRGVWVATYLCGRGLQAYAALRPDGTTTVGKWLKRKTHVDDALGL